MRREIRYLKREQIDVEKWDHCIKNASNGLIYGYAACLDHMSRQWDALIYGDYDAVMPLTWKRKFGIYYLYQPAFTASLGIFGHNVSENVTNAFIASIPSKFRLIEISLNHQNITKELPPSSIIRSNFVLDLNREYSFLYSNYRDNIKRNIKKAIQFECYLKKDIEVDEILRLSKLQMSAVSNIKILDYTNLRKLYQFLKDKGQAISYGVYTPKNELLASCIFFFSHNRAYYILVGNHPNGKVYGASHFLIDGFIKEHAGKNMLLDFEGSDISNLAFFYSSFGAVEETYPALRINKLPGIVRVILNALH